MGGGPWALESLTRDSQTFVAANISILAHASPDSQAVTGAMFNTALQVGGGISLAILSAITSIRKPEPIPS